MKSKLIKLIRKYLQHLRDKKISIAGSSFAHLIIWTKSPGYARLKILSGYKHKEKLLKIFLRNLICRYSEKNFQISKNSLTEYNSIFISWSYKDCFKKNIYSDKYFGLNNQITKKFVWVLFPVDGFVPKKIPNNLIIINLKKNSIFLSILNSIKFIFTQLIKYRFSFSKSFHYIFSDHHTALIQMKTLEKSIDLEKIKKVVLPYEAQIFQKILIEKIKKKDDKSKIYGYLHSSLPALPSEYIYEKDLSPDKVFYHGKSYDKILHKKLFWPRSKLKLIKSLRYNLFQSKKFKAKIYVPYNFSLENENIFLEEFKRFTLKNKKYELKKSQIDLHPAFKNDKKHLNFKYRIKNIIKRFDKMKRPGKKIPIFLGSTTIFEGLEVYGESIHICADNLFEKFDEEFWPFLRISNLSDKTYLIKLLKKGEYIQFGNQKAKKNFVELIN